MGKGSSLARRYDGDKWDGLLAFDRAVAAQEDRWLRRFQRRTYGMRR